MNFHHFLKSLRTSVSIAAALCTLVLSVISMSQQAAAQQATSIDLFDPGKAELIVVPGAIKQVQGKYPATVNVILWLKACDLNDKSDHPKSFSSDAEVTYDITIAGAGLNIQGKPAAAGCKLTATVAIDQAAASSGYFVIDVMETNQNATVKSVDKGHAVLALMDSTAGPIPANPQVDVMWGVLSKDLCRDNFGSHVADDLYCIEVKIGNNTSHQIQLAGIGFKFPDDSPVSGVTLPNTSYGSVRASAQSFQLRSPRTLFVDGAEGLGILMAAFTPFFHEIGSQLRWTTGTSVIGSLLPGAAERMFPDQTLKQLNNLDDQTFRDGKLIPNNTQIRTMIFMEKRSLVEPEQHLLRRTTYKYSNLLKKACDKMYPAGDKNVGPNDAKNCAKNGDNPTAVKLALGQIVIVGDEIDYIQRVVVDSGVNSQEVNPSPSIGTVILNGAEIEVSVAGMAANYAKVTATILADTTNGPPANVPLDLDLQKSDANQLAFKVPSTTTLDSAKTYNIQFTLPNGTTVQGALNPTPATQPATPPVKPPADPNPPAAKQPDAKAPAAGPAKADQPKGANQKN